ncbi:biopolymer transporter ExbD [Brucepastera parasyntrophica]|uniref:ExbD/TolR family protein n=1 Tax=Brucepastera parasyntrophica TaxID=2880008 RepID=UPI00210E0693|nr:biopolymer transporter ExbD [Brucepastera parasyntrophica]ULQ58867.1 biopolymer transporter ExbD [Brucepastera parasyntrophica]
MKIKRRKRLSFSETSASSDVAFLLIIYFLVIAGFNVNFGFLLTLPAKDSTRMILKDDLMRFDMDESGFISYEGGLLSLGDAETIIRSAVNRHPNLAVVLSIDSEAPWQEVVSFVELAQKLEVDSFSFNMKGSI